jgi:flavin reductase (DIM6/NTAB) family NADH-FMN oxidoreductase RutF
MDINKVSIGGGAVFGLLPVVMVSCAFEGVHDIVTVAWTGMLSTKPPKTYISLRKSRFSYELIKSSGEFVINVVTRELMKSADYCGIYTGRKVDKFQKCSLNEEEAEKISAPRILESPLSIECKVESIQELGSHDMFIASIECVYVKAELLDKSGKLSLDKAGLVGFCHGEYYPLGKPVGRLGFSAKKR